MMSDSDKQVPPDDSDARDAEATESVPGDGVHDSVDADSSVPDSGDGLLSRLRVIEDQPLESRAAALTQIHDELRARLESSDSPHGA
ncbi:hypothetical protein GCM10027515_34270 [Schumannella luteola]